MKLAPLALAFALLLVGCTPAARASAARLLAREIQCALAHQNLPDAQILAECAVTPENIKDVVEIVGTQRKVAAARECKP